MTLRFRWLTALMVAGLALGNVTRAQDGELRDKALSLNNVTGDEAIVGKMIELRKDKAGLKKLIAESVRLAKEKPKDPPFNFTAGLILAKCAQSIKEYDDSEFFYKGCLESAFKLKSSQKIAQVLEGLIDLFERAKKYDDAFFTCQKFLDLKGDKDDSNIEAAKPFIMEQMVQLLCQQQKFEQALDLAEKLAKFDEDGWYFVRRKAEVLREWGKSEEALKTYKEVVERLDKSKLKGEDRQRYLDLCKYVMSGIHVDLKEFDKGVQLLEELLKAKPDNATYNNDLGYLLADNDKRLDEAEKMIRKALELEKAQRKTLKDEGKLVADEDHDNSAYLDSLAWVYFKQKKYAEARDIMLEVVKSDEAQHVEIYDHLAEVYLALGQKDDAIKAWKKGLSLDNVSNRDDARKAAVKKKLAANKKQDD